MHCQDCGHSWTGPGYDSETLPTGGCPNCGSYRTQVSPTHSDMGRDTMPSAGEGLDDPGGNPLQEGIWGSTDGGWQNRMKRDESFASVTAAHPHDENPYNQMEKWRQDAERMEQDRLFMEGPKHKFDDKQGYDPWEDPPYDAEVLAEMQAEDPHRFQHLLKTHPKLIQFMAFEGTAEPGHSEEWLGQGTDDGSWKPGMWGRGLVDHNGQLHTWDAEKGGIHAEYMRKNRIPETMAEFSMDPQGNVDVHHGDLSPYVNQLQAKGLMYEEDYDPFANLDFDAVDDPNPPEEPMPENMPQNVASNREKIYLVWSHDTSSVDSDFEVEQVVPPGPHTEEVDYGDSTPLILQHDDPQLLDNAKEKLQTAKTAQWQALLPLLTGGGEAAAGAGGAELMGGGMMGGPLAQMGGSGLISGLVRGAMGNGQAAGGAPQAQPYQMDSTMLSSIHNNLLSGFDGPFDDHPSSDDNLNERADGDPEDADPHEVNDGDHDHWQRDVDVNDGGGTDSYTPETIQALQDAGPALIHYFNSEESGAEDPSIKRLVEVLERDHPGLIDQEPSEEELAELHHFRSSKTAMGIPGIGGMPVPAPQPQQGIAQPQQQVNPMTQATCPHCGARLTEGQGVCPQCNGSVSLAPNAPVDGSGAGAYPAGVPMTGQPGQGQQIMAANQGPHNPEQFQAVANYLRQQGQEDQIQDLIDHPENYGDILAQIQGKGQPPQPDPDPGVPPPPPPPMMPPGGAPGGAPPGMPMQAAADAVTPPCPKCDSHTTGLISDEGMAQCSNCNHKWQTDFEVQGDKTPVQPKAAAEHPGNWVDNAGRPLEVGQQYEMKSPKYDIPDQVKIESVKPDEIEYSLTGAYNLSHRTAISKEEADLEGYSFEYAGTDENAILNEQGPNDQMEAPSMAPTTAAIDPYNFQGPVQPEEHAMQSVNFPNEAQAPPTTCPGCGAYTKPVLGGCPHCNSPMGPGVQGGGPVQDLDQWTRDTVPNPPEIGEDPHAHKFAGQKFTPMEQREFIDEPGVARNSDKLELEGTHYTEQPSLSDDLFLFGL